jgi:hypothetical protein
MMLDLLDLFGHHSTASIVFLLLCAYVVAALVLGVAKHIFDPPSRAECIAAGFLPPDDDEPLAEPAHRAPPTGRGAKKKARRRS